MDKGDKRNAAGKRVGAIVIPTGRHLGELSGMDIRVKLHSNVRRWVLSY